MAHDNSGVMAVIVAILVPAFMALAALAIDMSYAYWTRTQLQHTATAAALAGVTALLDADDNDVPDNNDYRDMAIRYAYMNMEQARHGAVIHTSCGVYDSASDIVVAGNFCTDVEVGNWAPAPVRTFTARYLPNGTDNTAYDPLTMSLDAVRAVTRKAQVNGNPLGLFLAAAVGLAKTDISTEAIAWAQGGGEDLSCYEDGMIAGGWVDIQSNNSFINDYCIYGNDGVRVQSDNYFETGVVVGYGPDGVLDEQGSMNNGLAEASQHNDTEIYPAKAQQIDEMISDLVSGTYPPFVAFGDAGTIYDSTLPAFPIPHTTYIISGTATITADLSNLVIIANKIDVGSGVILTDMVLVATDSSSPGSFNINLGSEFDIDRIVLASYNGIEFGSWGIMGGGLCDGANEKTVQVLAKENIEIASNTTISNAEILAGIDVNLQSNNAVNLTGNGATIQAINDIRLASDGDYGACAPTGGGEETGPIAGLEFRIVH